jgi:protein-tyrosine-phosphatase
LGNPLEEGRLLRILFVCTGNICRSPMAVGLARAAIERDYPEMSGNLSFSSAGVAALDGNAPTREAVEVMMERGIDISDHRAIRVTRNIVEASDLVLTMEEAQKRLIEVTAGGAGPPVSLIIELGEAAGKLLEASDWMRSPTGGLQELLRNAREVESHKTSMRKKSKYEVPDPIGMPAGEYRRVVVVMEEPIEKILRALILADA